MVFDGDKVIKFAEKPKIDESWINGGFFILEPEVLNYIEGDGTHWEREPLERLTEDGQLMVYRHNGFWQCMDNIRDLRYLRKLWNEGKAPWKLWED
jgi:glucose-1-phosphate cytidylyltransferase